MTQNFEKRCVESSVPGHYLCVDQWVKVVTSRPNREQYNLLQGQVKTITNRDIVYVLINERTACFYAFELVALAPEAA